MGFLQTIFKKQNPNPLLGDWFSDLKDEVTMNTTGKVKMTFTSDGKLIYQITESDRTQIINLTYTIKGNTITTDQHSHPQKETTEFTLINHDTLVLNFNGESSQFKRIHPMKAIVLESAENPIVYKEVDKPSLANGEVLVQVKAAALNRRDYWITIGRYAGIKYPTILGSDGAGIVTEVGEGVDAVWLGKEVILNPSHDYGDSDAYQGKDFKILGLPEDGTFAEYVKTRIVFLHDKPAHLSWEQAAAIPLAGLTSYRALFTKGQLKAGNKVLIVGAGSGTGAFCIQWAVAAGCEVYVTSGTAEKIELAKQLGATAGANYKDADWDKQLHQLAGGFDVVIDSALGDGFAKLPDICNPGARIVTFGGTAGDFPAFNARKFFYKQLQLLGSMMGTATEFKAMLEMVNRYKIIPVIDEVIPLAEAEKAISKMEKSTQFGKIVLKVS